MSDKKLYQLPALTPGGGDLVYLSRPDGSADGSANFTALTPVLAGVLTPTFAAASHGHALSNISDAGALAAKDNVGDADWAGGALSIAHGGTGATTAAAARTALGLAVGADVQGFSNNLAAIAGAASAADKLFYFTGTGAGTMATLSAFARTILDDADAAAVRATIGAGIGGGDLVAVNNLSDVSNSATAGANIRPVESIIIACGDEATAVTSGNGKVAFRMPYAFTVTAVRASLTTAQASGSIFTVDINEAGATIISTKLTVDNTEKTSTTAATPAVISDTSLADDAEITVDVDQVGDGTAKGLKIVLIGHRT